MLGAQPAAMLVSRFELGQGFPHLHVHHAATELFVVLDGEVRFEVGGLTIVKTSGEAALVEAGIPHAFEVTGSPARIAIVVSPPELLQMIIELSSSLGRSAMADVLSAYNSELVG